MQLRISLALCLLATLSTTLAAETYRVGAGEKYSTISEISHRLLPGDVVEVTGDIEDHFVLTRHGTSSRPITIRGMARMERGGIVRPKIVGTQGERLIASCRGDNTVFEGIEFTAPLASEQRVIALAQSGDNLTIRNCVFRNLNWKAIVSTPKAGSITVEFCEFDSVGNLGTNGKTIDVWSWQPGALMTVEHCYFHDATGGVFLKSHAPRNVIRYNWFENCHLQAIKIVDRIGNYVGDETERPEGVYPMHTDVVGNVFFQGWSPGSRYSILSLGGAAEDEPGTEGDFHIAHNLFVMSRAYETDPGVHLLVPGNVDHIRMYNNVFLELGGPGCRLYERGAVWEVPATVAFRAKRGHGEPIVEGANNWISVKSLDLPQGFQYTLRGTNPRFVDLINFDFRPAKDSPLAGAGLSPLPRGQIVDLVPEYEPQRGIPSGLRPHPRRKVAAPSIGPFEVAE